MEIEKTGSINRAAENLYMGQPNLSRAIKELETSLGITIFVRSSKGMIPTPQGAEFLQYAKKLLREVDVIENLYKKAEDTPAEFSISVPRASYIAHAFTEFSKKLEGFPKTRLFYRESAALRTVKQVSEQGYRLGIVRYACQNSGYFKRMLEEKGLLYETVAEFTHRLILSEQHPLAACERVEYADLAPYTEVAQADSDAPTLSMSPIKDADLPENTDHRIHVFERATQLALLAENPTAFSWAAPIPEPLLRRYGLVQKVCVDNPRSYTDVLIYRRDYALSELDKRFITELCETRRKFVK